MYVKTKTTDTAQAACKALHGRFFAGGFDLPVVALALDMVWDPVLI